MRSKFDLTHDVKLSGRMGNLIPTLALEAVPGDSFNIGCDALIRFAPMLAPIMHRVDVSMHYFFVPNRILWENWEPFITGNEAHNPPFIRYNVDSDPTHIKFLDYFGLPTPIGGSGFVTEWVNALPLAAYQCIYHEFYRDQNLIGNTFNIMGDGEQSIVDMCTMYNRAWEHDYFTAALPWAQKGSTVDIPLGEVKLNPDWISEHKHPFFIREDGTIVDNSQAISGGAYASPATPYIQEQGDPGIPLAMDPAGSLEVGATTINDLRRAFKLQEWLERNARGGTRYTESILAHFGVKSPDSRLQRPEYICGIKAPVIISEVLNTTGTFDAGGGVTGSPQGDMAGHGVSVPTSKNTNYYCQEHGWIIGIMSVMPKPAYQQGIHKQFTRKDHLDYYWPSFANCEVLDC